jgi:signal transduction histidine kinase
MSQEKRIKAAAGSLPGVGLRGMRERIVQLGGEVEINSNAYGTLIVARLPFASAAVSSPMTAQATA